MDLVVAAIVSALTSFFVARVVARTSVGISQEQESVRDLERWVDGAASLAADVGGVWSTHGHAVVRERSDAWSNEERRQRIELRRIERHLPSDVDHGRIAAQDLSRFNEAAVGGDYRSDLLRPDYTTPPPVPDGGESWEPVGQWIDSQQRIVAEACAAYLSKGRDLLRWLRA